MRSIALTILPLLAGFLVAQERTETRTTVTKTTWNGTLVDAACQTSHVERRETREPGVSTTTRTETIECPVTASTTSFGLLTADGQFIRFDNPSNTRVVEIVRNNRSLSPYLTGRTPLRARVIGTANGDVAVVESFNPELDAQNVGGQTDMIFDARYHDDRGRLVVTATGVNFEDLSDHKHSRSWSYREIKELKRDGANEIKIEGFSGGSSEIHLDGPGMPEAAYRIIGDRIAAARSR